MVEAAQRTPVSFLQMMCNQKSLTPEYELISVEGVSHEPTFTYKLKVKDVLVTAAGLSKKKAKHLAAKNALDQLLANKGSDTDSFIFEDVTITAENINEYLLEPVSEPVRQNNIKNPISALQEFCSKNQKEFSHPYYETVGESGLPHDKIFVEHCLIIRYEEDEEVEKFVTVAEGKTKKIARRDAAEMMMKKLEKYQKNVSVDVDNCVKKSQEDTNDEVISVPCVESAFPVAKSDVGGLFNHEDSTKNSETCGKLEELRTDVSELHCDSD